MRTRVRAFVDRHPAVSYFVLTFVISWGGVLLVTGPTGLVVTREQFERLLPMWSVALVAGPAISGVLLTGLVQGRRGLRDYGSRLIRWRVGARWYVVALLTAPLYFTAVLLVLSLRSSDFLPAIFAADDRAALLVMGIAVALTAGILEELGWTGFAVPTLRRRHGIFATGVIVGVLWGVWHFLVKIWAAGAFGLLPFLPADLASAVLGLTAYRILMVWVHDRTRSLFVAILMHLSLTATTVILGAQATGRSLAIANLVLAIGWWVLIGAVVAARHWRASRPTSLGHAP